jgi:hypothetical protein
MGGSKLTGTAAKLLDAQVAFLLAELSGDRLEQLLAADTEELLAIAGRLVVREVIDADHVKVTARRCVDLIGGSQLVVEVAAAGSDTLYDLSASEDYQLGSIFDHDAVSALAAKLLGMHRLQDRAMERMADSPLLATIATKFVGQIVSDFVAQNRQQAERIPGAASLFSIGQSVAKGAKSVSDRTLGGILDGAADKGAQLALKRTNGAVRELIRDPSMQAAVMELWDLHAEEPISGLRSYLSKQELRELTLLIHELIVTGRNEEFVGHVLDAGVDVFFDNYGDYTIAALLPELDIDPAQLVVELQTYVPPVVAAAIETGAVEKLLRARLAPFFASPAVAAILEE